MSGIILKTGEADTKKRPFPGERPFLQLWRQEIEAGIKLAIARGDSKSIAYSQQLTA